MKFELYFWPTYGQAWVLSWGLVRTMSSMGVLNRHGNILSFRDPAKINQIFSTTTADAVILVGFEHFRGKIPVNKLKHNNKRVKIISWSYESLTDPYGASAWGTACPGHFLSKYGDFLNGFTVFKDDEILKHYENIDAVFAADEVDYDRFNSLGIKSFWLPFGVDTDIFKPELTSGQSSSIGGVQSSGAVRGVDTQGSGVIRYYTKYGVRSSRIVNPNTQPTNQVFLNCINKGCFVGTQSNVRVRILNRLGLGLQAFQTKRKQDFSNQDIALTQTKDLAQAYNKYLISFNLTSIFGGITPRALETMACGKLLFQYLCAPNRTRSNNMLKNCVKYEIFTNVGLNRVKELYQHYATHPGDALVIGKKAREEVLNGHTLRHRVNTIAEKLKTLK